MPIKLKSRNQACVDGFKFHERSTGWKSWQADPQTQWDFRALVAAIQAHRKANPRFNLNTDLNVIAEEADTANALRMKSIFGADSYYIETGGGGAAQPPKTMAPLQNLVSVAVGAKILVEWLGEGGNPVDQSLAEHRASICAGCNQNGPGDWLSVFTAPVANQIKKQIALKRGLRLETGHDKQLGLCMACSCPLPLKVFTPLKHINNHMTDAVKVELEKVPHCWILKE